MASSRARARRTASYIGAGILAGGGGGGAFSPLVSTDWRQPILAGYDSGGSIGPALAASSASKTIPSTTVAAATTTAITSPSVSGYSSNVLTISATAHGLVVGDYVQLAGWTSTPSGNANGIYKVQSVPDANTFTITCVSAFTGSSPTGGTVAKITPATADLSVKLDTVDAAGAFLYYYNANSPAFQLAFFESADSATGAANSGSWSPISHSLLDTGANSANGPQDNAKQRGGLVGVATSGWKRMRIANYNPAGSITIALCAGKKYKAGSVIPDITFDLGSSLVYQGDDPIAVRQRIQDLDPTRDPIIVNAGYPGANGATINSTFFSQFIAWGIRPSAVVYQVGPNDVGQGRPYSSDVSPTNIAAAIQAALDWVNSNWSGVPVFVPNVGWVNFTSAPLVSDLASPLNGAQPYNQNQVHPKIKNAAGAYNWNAALQRPVIDQEFAFGMYPPAAIFVDGTTHPISPYYHLTNDWVRQSVKYMVAGNGATPFIELAVAAREARGVPANDKSRLQTLITAEDGSLAAILTRINNLPTTYSGPSYTKISDVVTPLFHYDMADHASITQSGMRASQVNDKSSNAYHLTQATSTKQPYMVLDVLRKNWRLAGSNGANLSAPAGLISALDAAAQPFMLFFAVQGFGVGTAGAFFGVGQSTANKIQIAPLSDIIGSNGQIRLTAATSGVPNGTPLLTSTTKLLAYKPTIVAMGYDGTNIVMNFSQRDSTGNIVQERQTVAWAKPAWTADKMNFFCNGPDLSRFAGFIGEAAGAASYSLADFNTIIAGLESKWLAAPTL